MRVFVPDMTEFFAWLERCGYRYAVMRGFLDFDRGYPPTGARRRDIDMLVEDAAQRPIAERYGRYRRRQGVECDVYNVSGADHGGLRGLPYYPRPLAERLLAERRLWKGLFYVPGAEAHLLSLIYHIAYHKAEGSLIDLADPARSSASKYCRELATLTAELKTDLPLTLLDFHRRLQQAGHALPYEALVNVLQHDFRNGFHSLFRTLVCAEGPGELNLFVIRQVAVKKRLHTHLLRQLQQQYDVLAVKEIPLMTRLLKARRMRGGKWRRGGYPALAVVVFDPQPIAATAEDRKIHPCVFNSRQFVKRAWREWFTQTSGAKSSANPIHSTDNEAEAVAHLPLFFSAAEQAAIFKALGEKRAALPLAREMPPLLRAAGG